MVKKEEYNFEVFETELNGVMTKFKVYEPNLTQQREAMKVRNRTFYDAVDSGALLKVQLIDIMRERNLWNDVKQAEYSNLEQQILDSKEKLNKGGFKLSEARGLALDMQKWRDELVEMKVSESQLANETAEGQADNASFNYLVSTCVVYNDNEQPVFNGLDDYLNKSLAPSWNDITLRFAKCLAALTYGVRSDIEKQLPENEFLLEYGFVDNELRLIDENGELINENGEVVDEDGFAVEEKQEIIERKPFLDEDGGEIIRDQEKLDKKLDDTEKDELDDLPKDDE